MTSTAAACLPRGSPPASWPARSAATSRRATGASPRPASHAVTMASITSGPASMLPWAANAPAESVRATPPAHAWHRSPVKVATPPRQSTTPAWRSSRWGSSAKNSSSTRAADIPLASMSSPRVRSSRLLYAWVARAPAPTAAAGTYAPAARNLLASATPVSSPSALRPTIENVMPPILGAYVFAGQHPRNAPSARECLQLRPRRQSMCSVPRQSTTSMHPGRRRLWGGRWRDYAEPPEISMLTPVT